MGVSSTTFLPISIPLLNPNTLTLEWYRRWCSLSFCDCGLLGNSIYYSFLEHGFRPNLIQQNLQGGGFPHLYIVFWYYLYPMWNLGFSQYTPSCPALLVHE